MNNMHLCETLTKLVLNTIPDIKNFETQHYQFTKILTQEMRTLIKSRQTFNFFEGIV